MIRLAAALVVLATTVVDAASFCSPAGELCFTSTPVGTTAMKFEVTSKARGWVAIGFGSDGMNDADIIMMYSVNGRGIVSDRYSNAEVMPVIDRTQSTTDISISNGVYRFTRLLSTGDSSDRVIARGQTPMIWAASSRAVTDEQNIGVHDSRGSFKLDLFSATASVSGGLNYKTMVLAHGVLMVVGWALCSYAAVFIARYMKVLLGVWWYRAHVGLMVTNALLTTAGFVLVVMVTTGKHFDGLHQALGLVVFVAMWVQSVLGQVINHLFDPNRTSIPLWDKAHWWLGRLIVFLATVNIFLGLHEYEESLGTNVTLLMALFGIYVALVLVGAAVTHWKMGGQTHHHEESVIHGGSTDNARLRRRAKPHASDSSLEMEISAPQATMI